VDRLEAAGAQHRPCRPVRDLIGDSDIAVAYAVQRELTQRRLDAGATISGRKIGLTSPAVQGQMGVDQPDFGVLFADMDVSAQEEVPSGSLLQPRVEAEIAFVLESDLDVEDLSAARVREAVAYATAALEIVDSRIAGWDIHITDTVADNASSGLYVLSDKRLLVREFEPVDVTMHLYADDTLVSEGNGAACLDDPLNALAWLATTARKFGEPLRAGQVILSGALGAMVPASPGTTFRAEISSLGPVTATFSKEE
jgi:2-keto-4-pentenoate hydratase